MEEKIVMTYEKPEPQSAEITATQVLAKNVLPLSSIPMPAVLNPS
ncbi:hypothetical protein L798_06071 [Zootermopsis nevadensis]|uniref:Uncharacterized protein n=1 Tax=Zootermopsis nevadensis TaxID=136037 RepID=A0A067R7F3_ZOONE|nr:hypothetical protein L798_06071 [Zootermopsis nevadensis]